MDAGEDPGSSRVPWPATLAVAAGLAVRLVLCFRKPLWADEIFTLTVARRSIPGIVEALRLDSGPPLHYLLSKLVLWPFGGPGPADVAVRLLSLLAAGLHVPLILTVARRLGAGRAGWSAAALYALFPVAVVYGAEGRAYAVASLLVLAAFERSLALRERPSVRTAVVAGALGALALLTHYLALFPLAGMGLAFWRRGPWRFHLVSGAVAAAGAVAWLPVALAQPRASMAWVAGFPDRGEASRAAVALLAGIDGGGAAAPFLLAAALAVLLLALRVVRDGDRAAATLLAGGSLYLLAGLAFPEILIPDRGAAAFLPFTALVLARAGGPVAAAAGGLSAAFLLLQAPVWTRRSPGEDLAAHLAEPVRRGGLVVASGLWGPELAYRMAILGRPSAVALFPSDVARHPGWFSEEEVPAERLAAEAKAITAGRGAPRFFVLPRGSRAAEALGAEVRVAGADRVGATPFLEVYLTRPGAFPPGKPE